ncbi:hypothetical protein [Micromonospora marina]|uniref:hypothetical protein n=1 Tax=Micromonospora marina TaxID=307120 RepID=UPI0034557E94
MHHTERPSEKAPIGSPYDHSGNSRPVRTVNLFRTATIFASAAVLALTGTLAPPAKAQELSTSQVVDRAVARAELAPADAVVIPEGDVQLHSDRVGGRISDGDISIGIELSTGQAQGVAHSTGNSYEFTDVAHETDAATRAFPGSVQLLTVMRDKAAGNEQRYQLSLPTGVRLVKEINGGFLLQDADEGLVGVIEAPWAYDATGRSLPTSYTVEGDVLVQRTVTDEAAYPIVADPKLTFGRGVYLNLKGGEVRTYGIAIVAMGGGAIAVGCATLDKVPHVLKVLARIACGAGVISLAKVFDAVKAIARDGRISDSACYQVRIIPTVKRDGDGRVSSKNCN